MAIRTNTAEGGTNGTVVTNETQTGGGSGNAFNTVIVGANSSISFSNVQRMHGSLAYRCSGASGERSYFGWTVWNTLKSGTTRSYFYFPTMPGVTHLMVGAYSTAGARFFELYLGSNNRLILQDRNGTLNNPAHVLQPATWYRIEAAFQMGTAGGDGIVNFAFYEGDSTTALGSFSSTTANTGVNTETFSNFNFGKCNAAAATYDTYIDSITAEDGRTTLLGPYVATNQPPTANAGSAQSNIEPYTTVTLSGTDNDPDGTVVSRQWRQISGTPTVTLSNATTATATYTAPGTIAGTTLTFGYQVTDNGGTQSTESTVTNTILGVTERAVVGGVEVPVRTAVAKDGGLV